MSAVGEYAVTSRTIMRVIFIVLVSGLTSACVTSGIGSTASVATPEQTTVSAPSELIAALEGGLVQRAQGDRLSRGDRQLALQNEYRALEYTAPGEAVLWQGKSINGRIVPSQPYRVGSQDCRQYEHTIVDRTAESTVRGTACRNENGSWTLLS